MSKLVAGYWLLGCVLTGLAWGWHLDRCPNDPFDTDGLLVAVVAWPAPMMAALNSKHRPLVCRNLGGEPQP